MLISKLIRWVLYLVLILSIMFAVVITLQIIRTPPTLPNPAMRAQLAKQLFEFGAIRFVHRTEPKADEIAQIFEKVVAGEVLDAAMSVKYRRAFHAYLATRQSLFKALDANLVFATDFGMTEVNNTGGSGVAGNHDLHDLSALSNLSDIQHNLARLGTAGWFGKVFLVNDISKDEIDFIVHMAPAVHALGVADPSFLPIQSDSLAQDFRAMQRAFKAAQFADVNSCNYWQHIDAALVAYLRILQDVDQVIQSETTVLQRKIAGLWLAPQTIAPQLDINDPLRQRPDCPALSSTSGAKTGSSD